MNVNSENAFVIKTLTIGNLNINSIILMNPI